MKKLLTVFAVLLVLVLALSATAMAADIAEGRVVSEGELDSITTVNGHTIASYTIVKKPTCTERGIAHFHCTEPNCAHYHIVYIAALGHDWSSQRMGNLEWGNIIVTPTCTRTGLAIDVCLRCRIVNEDVTRVINMLPHVYSATTLTPPGVTLPNKDKWLGYFVNEKKAKYVVITAPTCVTEGDAYRVCLECGYIDREYKVSLTVVPHTWTDWRQNKLPTCDAEGAAEHACIVCGAHQYLTWATDTDQKNHSNWYKMIQVLNPNWDNTMAPILLNQADPTKGCEWERVRAEDWLTTCYTHTDVYTCPYCKGKSKAHNNVKDEKMPLTSHLWKTTKEDVKACPISTTIWTKENDKARLQYAWDNACSLAATCLYDGFDLYKCCYDREEFDSLWEANGTPSHRNSGDPNRYKVLRVNALGHNWDKWDKMQEYTLNGRLVYLYVRGCKRCGATQEKITYADGSDDLVMVDTLTLNKTSKTLKVGKTFTLKATVNANATVKAVRFESSDEKIATVSAKGKVKALKKGVAYITVYTTDGSNLSATCKITVK